MTQERTKQWIESLPPSGIFTSELLTKLFIYPPEKKLECLLERKSGIELKLERLELENNNEVELMMAKSSLKWVNDAIVMVNQRLQNIENRK